MDTAVNYRFPKGPLLGGGGLKLRDLVDIPMFL